MGSRIVLAFNLAVEIMRMPDVAIAGEGEETADLEVGCHAAWPDTSNPD